MGCDRLLYDRFVAKTTRAPQRIRGLDPRRNESLKIPSEIRAGLQEFLPGYLQIVAFRRSHDVALRVCAG